MRLFFAISKKDAIEIQDIKVVAKIIYETNSAIIWQILVLSDCFIYFSLLC